MKFKSLENKKYYDKYLLVKNFKSIYQSQNKTKSFTVKKISQNIFFKFLNFIVFTFSKNRQFGELFQKRFAIGICDLGGYR